MVMCACVCTSHVLTHVNYASARAQDSRGRLCHLVCFSISQQKLFLRYYFLILITPLVKIFARTRARACMHAHTVCLDKLSQTKIVPVKGNYKMQFLLILFPIHLMNSTAAAATTRAYTCTHVCVCECVFDLVYKCLFKSPVYVHHRLM